MKIKSQSDLLFLNILSLLLILVILFSPSNALRVVFGLPFVLFLPGYVMTAALFPRKNALDNLERIGLSVGLNITVVSFIGLLLNYTPWGIRLYPIIISLMGFIAIGSAVTWHRRQRLVEAERFTVPWRLNLASWQSQTLVDKVLSVILLTAILGTLGTLSYVLATPKIGEKFTEFYFLGQEGKATKYPKEMKVGELGSVTIGISNREQKPVSYRVEVWLNGTKQNEIDPVRLPHEEKWEEKVSFTATQPGDDQKVEFWLYKEGQSEVYRAIHLWVDVRE